PLAPGDASLTLAVNNKTVTAEFTGEADIIIVTPDAPVFEANVITIPEVEGVDYVIGDQVVSGDVEITEDVTVDARALEGYALDETATASWDFVYVAPAPEVGNLF